MEIVAVVVGTLVVVVLLFMVSVSCGMIYKGLLRRDCDI